MSEARQELTARAEERKTLRPVGEKRKMLPDDVPFVDVAAYLFLEDIAEKQGAAGMNNYLMSLATSLARSMPAEEYDSWEDFVQALKAGDSIISAFENVILWSNHCVVTSECPFSRGWTEYTKRIGNFSKVHSDVAEFYNSSVKQGAIDTQCIIHQTFRIAAAERIKVAGQVIRCAQVACVHSDGGKRVVPEEWKPILLQKALITNTELNMILRNNACVWVLYMES